MSLHLVVEHPLPDGRNEVLRCEHGQFLCPSSMAPEIAAAHRRQVEYPPLRVIEGGTTTSRVVTPRRDADGAGEVACGPTPAPALRT